ncbi:helix-turn-helix transcriptional regulator [Ornithinimicrobium cavernae]|uniref:helix-turn-helix transcriptional regulator n=1 Tax=Ornithinimicrobium cavernae TaxID=2666047 RepID=UPI00192A1F26|nr:helix-turn-helix transcriptional regulator [Ornithinimicrobium cavernae]
MDPDGLARARGADGRPRQDPGPGGHEVAPVPGPAAVSESVAAPDLVARGTSEFLTGHSDAAVRSLQEAYRLQTQAGAASAALRTAFLLATIFDRTSQHSLFQGWLGRAQRHLTSLAATSPDVPVERGLVAMLELRRALAGGRFDLMGPLAEEISAVGLRHGDPDLIALGALCRGRLAIYGGDVAGGLTLLDEAVTGVLAGDVSPLTAGVVYCTAIEGCQEIGALDRLCQWTEGLVTWCGDQPGLAAYAGACALHHGQVLTLKGDWDRALEMFAAAHTRYLSQGERGAAGAAQRERGDLLRVRGDLAGAEEAYQYAVGLGCDPQPGLALLWLARGRREAASAAVRRWLDETQLPAQRTQHLPAVIEVLIGVGDDGLARTLAEELDSRAALTGCEPVAAAAAQVHALVELASGDAAAALPYARKAIQLWLAVDAPYEGARSRLVLARALETLGDEDSAVQELREAATVLQGLEVAVDSALGALGGGPRAAGFAPSAREGTGGAGARFGSASAPGPGGGTVAGGAAHLTEREVEVLRLVAAGHSNRQIATQLVLSERTVARHLSNIFGKLRVGSRTAAAAYAFEHGLGPSVAAPPQSADLQ